MFNQITTSRPAKQPPEDALELLTGCHQRIRHFTTAAIKLAHAQGASPEDIRHAASGVYRYYSVSLPLHEADEEVTLRPRLDAVVSEPLRHALTAMHDQHQAIDELVERLLPLLMLVERNPDTLQNVGAEMCSITKALNEAFTAHLHLEEEVIFPSVRESLADHDRAAMLAEMRARRQQG